MIQLKKDKIIENPHDIISKNEVNSFFKFDVENEKLIFGSGENVKEYSYDDDISFPSVEDRLLYDDSVDAILESDGDSGDY